MLQWVDADGSGTVASFTVVRRGISTAYDAPYIVVLIDLSEGPRMMSQLEDVAPDDPRVRVGAQVQVSFKAWSEEINLPVFRLLD